MAQHESVTLTGEADFKLGDWWVRPSLLVLERGEESPHLEARTMAVLVCLARHAPALVTKERLLEEVWADTPFVSEEVISHAVWELRRALGDAARAPSYIQTIARKGYRLLVEVARPTGSPLPLPGARIAHYDLETELGRGSMGVVWKAVDRRLDRPVAIKFLAPELTRDAEACRRFLREARLAASLDHPNLATVLEVGETSQGQLYLVTPFYAGGSLKDRLMRGPVPSGEASSLLRQLAAGLAAAHRRGIVHRDVKPANLLLDDHGTLKLADFGIAKLLGSTDLTRTGAALGTPAYKSPEQSRGQAVDHRTDLWSAGVVLFELLTGRRPFDGEYEQAVVHSILANEPQALESADGSPVPEGLRQIVAKAMAKEPSERYQSGEAMVAALEAAAAGGPLAVAVVRRRPSRGARWLAAAAAAVVLVVSTALAFWPRETISDDARMALQRGQTAWLRGNDSRNLREAERHFRRAVELEPEWVDALGHLAVFEVERYALGRVAEHKDSALELINRARRVDRGAALPLVAEATFRLLEDHYPEAERLARLAMDREPDCERDASCDLAYVVFSEALWQLQRKDEAFRILDTGARVGGGSIRCLLKKAQLRDLDGESLEAIREYERVLDVDGQQTTALNELGLLYVKMRQYEKAVPLFNELVRLADDTAFLLNRGNALYEQGRMTEAIKDYQEADERQGASGESTPLTAVALGDAYMESSNPAEAQRWYETALTRFDHLVEAGRADREIRARRAVCLAKTRKFERAEEEIEKLLPMAKEFPPLLYYAARIAALEQDRAALFTRARQAINMEINAESLLNDAAFIPYRKDEEYLRLLGSAAPGAR